MSPDVQGAVAIVAVVCSVMALAFFLSYAFKDPDDAKQPETKLPDEKPLVPIAKAPEILGFARVGDHFEGMIGSAVVTLRIADAVTVVARAPGIPSTMSLREEPNYFLRTLQGGEDFLLGDDSFDDAIRVEGQPTELLAALDLETRREALREIVKHDFVVAEGEVRWTQRVFTTGDELAAIARAAGSLASRLTVDRLKIAGELADNLLTEPLPAIRLRVLQTLGAEYRGSPATARAARQAALDPDVAVRIAAANLASGADAVNQLLAVAKDPAAGDESRAAALTGLVGQLPISTLAPVLESFLGSGSRTLAVAALKLGASAAWKPPIEALLKMTEAVHPDARAAAAALLDATDARAERRLLVLLENNETPVMVAAIHALGRGASLAAIEKLLPISNLRFGSMDVRIAAGDAIKKIRERNPGGSSGQLTMTDDLTANAGRVSISSDDRGAVSVAQHAKKQTE